MGKKQPTTNENNLKKYYEEMLQLWSGEIATNLSKARENVDHKNYNDTELYFLCRAAANGEGNFAWSGVYDAAVCLSLINGGRFSADFRKNFSAADGYYQEWLSEYDQFIRTNKLQTPAEAAESKREFIAQLNEYRRERAGQGKYKHRIGLFQYSQNDKIEAVNELLDVLNEHHGAFLTQKDIKVLLQGSLGKIVKAYVNKNLTQGQSAKQYLADLNNTTKVNITLE